jgi:hypothetical protein
MGNVVGAGPAVAGDREVQFRRVPLEDGKSGWVAVPGFEL